MIVQLEPAVDDDLGLLGCGELFGIEHFSNYWWPEFFDFLHSYNYCYM